MCQICSMAIEVVGGGPCGPAAKTSKALGCKAGRFHVARQEPNGSPRRSPSARISAFSASDDSRLRQLLRQQAFVSSQRSSAAPCCSTSRTDSTLIVLGRCQGVIAVGETAPDRGFDQSSILLLSQEISCEAGVSACASRSARFRW